jgi:glyoxylase-like metal-dependent hydrolase (beta-lactamase superfamily II)
MKILKFRLGSLEANSYFLIEGSGCLIVDPADDASFILEELSRRRLKLKALLATHGHFDHIMAIGEIQTSLDVPFYLFQEDQFLVDRVGETAKHFLGYEPVVIKPLKTEYFKGGNMNIGDFSFDVIKTPGHTPGGASFYFKDDSVVFTGDTLFKGAIGRTDFSYCNKSELKESLDNLFKLPDLTIVYPGHEEETSIQEEKKNSGVFFDFLK